MTLTPDTVVCKGTNLTLKSYISSLAGSPVYTVQSDTFSWLSSAAPVVLSNLKDDTVQGPFNIGFTFNFYCNNYTQFFISSNGWISFGVKNDNSWTPKAIPSWQGGVPRNAVMGPWADWSPGPVTAVSAGGGSISYGVIGNAPFRQLVVTWSNMPLFGCNSSHPRGTFQVVLYETTNQIQENIIHKPAPCSSSNSQFATQGIQNMAGTAATVVPGRNSNIWNTSNESYKFKPGPSFAQITWYKMDSFYFLGFADKSEIKTGDTINIIPDNTVNYLVEARTCGGLLERDTLKLTVKPPLKVGVPQDTTICNGQRLQLTANGTGGKPQNYRYIWNQKDTGQSILARNDSSSQYRVVLHDYCSLKPDTAKMNVTVRPPLKMVPFKDTLICQGRSAMLIPKATGGLENNYRFSWQALDSVPVKVIWPTKDTICKVIVWDGCTTKKDSASINIKLRKPLKVSSPSDTTICKGSSIQLAAKGSGGDSTSYFYTWKGIDTTRVITIKPDSSASYQVVLQDFCTVKPDTARMYIRVRIAPSFSPRSDTTICVGQYVVLSMSILNGDTDGASILWKDFPTLKEVVVAPAITTFYEAILTDRCLASPLHDTSVVKVRPSLSLKLSPDTSVCYGNDVRIRAFPSGGLASQYQITWNDKTNGLYYDAKALKLSSNYYAILKDGCTIKPDSAGMKVTVSPELKVEIKDTLVCENTRLTVIPSISGGRKGANYSILWNESQVNNAPSFLIDSAQKVRVRVDDGCSLTAFDTANISVEPLPEVGFSADGNTVVCERKEVRFINESKYAPGSMFYWTLRDKDTAVSSDKFSYAFPDIGSFDIKLKIVSPLGCNDSFTRTGYMQVLPTPIVQFASSNNNINVDEGPLSFRPFTLSDSLTYTWVIEQDTIKSQLLEHHFKNAGVFPVTLIMSNVVGCWDMQTIQVKINDIYSLFVPNAITPNDDGVNDDLIIKGRGIEAFDLKILNRLGEVVFQTNDMNKKWNGKYENGNPAELDTYQCIISTTDAKGKAYLYKGNITVLR